MTDKYFMSGIYSPELYSSISSILPLVRELNYKYGLKVSSKLSSGFSFTNGREAVLMSYPSGLNICAVWRGNDDKYYLYSPSILKSRGADANEKSTISGKTIGIVTGLLNKYGGIPSETGIMQRHLSIVSNMATSIKHSVPSPKDAPNRYSLDDEHLSTVIHYVGHHMGLSENPNCEPLRPDPKMISDLIKGYANVNAVNRKRSELVDEMFSGHVLMVGAYPLTGHKFIPGVAGVVKVNDPLSQEIRPLKYEVIKPFHPVFSFEDIVNTYPEAMTRLIMTKARMEQDAQNSRIDLGFLKVMDHYEECVPYCTYYFKRDYFHLCWLAIPIEISDEN